MRRIVFPVTFLWLLCAAAAQEREIQPMPVFSGTLKRLDEETLVLELDDYRVLDFQRTSKTRFFDKKRPMDPARLKPGDAVSVEATQDMGGFLTAVNVYLEHSVEGTRPEASRHSPV